MIVLTSSVPTGTIDAGSRTATSRKESCAYPLPRCNDNNSKAFSTLRSGSTMTKEETKEEKLDPARLIRSFKSYDM